MEYPSIDFRVLDHILKWVGCVIEIGEWVYRKRNCMGRGRVYIGESILSRNKGVLGNKKGRISEGGSEGNYSQVDHMIAAKRAWSLYKKKKAAFLTW